MTRPHCQTVLLSTLALCLGHFSFTAETTVWAQSPVDKPTAARQEKPIRALLVTGGCCHDYARQKLIISRGVSARANVVWTIVHQGGTGTNAKIPLYEDAKWADGFDVVVHNECFANVRDAEWVERILKPHREGTPAVLIHCAMHCYRTGSDRWFKFVGVQSHRHGAHYGYTVENVNKDHPVMSGFGDSWLAPKGELYHTVKVFDTATPLAVARRRGDNQPQTCIWTNQYGKGRVFGTTIGHYNLTMAEPQYLDMLTRGILWAARGKDAPQIKKTSEATNAAIKLLIAAKVDSPAAQPASGSQKCCGEGNLAFGAVTKASSEESAKRNFARHAVDGDLGTRWCAASGRQLGESLQVDFGKKEHIKSLRIHWGKSGEAYRYTVQASADGNSWKTIVDASKNKKVARITPHDVDSPNTRYLKVSYLGSTHGMWASFWELEAYAGKLPKLPKGISNKIGKPAASISDVQAPAGFQVTLFGSPPLVNYPVCLTAAATGEVFVGVDPQGSLGKKPGEGRVLRCLDTDGDGVADKINTFAEMDHPRGLIYDNGSLWVLHPPTLSVYHDDDGDGRADRRATLITGISSNEVNKRGADHTTNGIRMGIDGWIYIAVGDYGFTEAKGTDGRTLAKRGGGIVRVRPNGREMEIYSWGQRNILDVSIDPYMNLFTRDNTNDGGGWDIRTTHIMQTAHYGYPSLFKNFTEEIMPPLASYGGGSGCGTMFFHDLRWPAPYGNAFYSCDWGRSEVYRHSLVANGPTFDPHQQLFLKIPRPTDIDVDGSGRMVVGSWKNGQFGYSGPNVGFVAQITPKDFVPKPFPDLHKATADELVGYLASPSAVYRLHSQRELLRRGDQAATPKLLAKLASDEKAPLYGRVAAIFTLKQLAGKAAIGPLVELSKDAAAGQFALRALTDRKTELDGVPLAPFVSALGDANLRVRAQALISLGRLGNVEVAGDILPLTRRASDSKPPTASPLWNQPDPGRVLPHLAVRALVSLDAIDACLGAIGGPYSDGALWALRQMHDPLAVSGLAFRLSTTHDKKLRHKILTALIRLYYREGEFRGTWWGTRPDSSGPYYDRQTWPESKRIARTLRFALADADGETARHIATQLKRHKVQIDGLASPSKIAISATPELQQPIKITEADPKNPRLIANLLYDQAAQQALSASGDVERGKKLFTQQSCIACHTFANGQTPKGPHLVDIGKRYKPHELVESLLRPSAKIAQGFDTYTFAMSDGTVVTGFVASESADAITIRETSGVARRLPKDEIDRRVKGRLSMMPEGVVGNLTPQQIADLIAYLRSLR